MNKPLKQAIEGRRKRWPFRPVGGWRLALEGCLSVVFMAMAFCASDASASTGHGFTSDLSEAPLGTRLLGPGSVAVDRATGQAFVADELSGYVDVYGPSGEYETRLGEGAVDAVGIAVDESDGDVYVAESFKAAVLVYEPDGTGGYRRLGEWLGKDTARQGIRRSGGGRGR